MEIDAGRSGQWFDGLVVYGLVLLETKCSE